MFKDKSGVEWLTYREIARLYGFANSTVGNLIREMKLETIKIPKAKGQRGGREQCAVKANDASAMMDLKGFKPVVTNGATKEERAAESLKAFQDENRKPHKRKERAHMSLHNIKAPFCPFCGARKVANVTTQSLRLCLKCGNVYTVQKFREGPDGE